MTILPGRLASVFVEIGRKLGEVALAVLGDAADRPDLSSPAG